MRGAIDKGILHLTILLLFAALFFTGCAAKLIQTVPASPQEEITVSAAFQDMLENQADCGCCLDAEAEARITASNWLGERSGTMTGFLQAMQPSYIKFVGINPLGQPLFVFITDGFTFQNLQVPKGKVYEGVVRSAAFNKYVPAWFEPEYGYYWLAGRIRPGDFETVSIQLDKEKKGFWLQLQYKGSRYRNMVLFDPQAQVVLRHIVMDSQNKSLIDVQYADYQSLSAGTENVENNDVERQKSTSESGLCRLPGSIRIDSLDKSGQIHLQLHSFLPGSEFTEEDFAIDIPSGFKRVPFK